MSNERPDDRDRSCEDEQPEAPTNVSRRGFIQTASLASAGVLAGCATPTQKAKPQGPSSQPAAAKDRVLSGAVKLRFELNGKSREVTVETRTTLAEALRGPLGLTGTKTPCERGACGGCTVQLDGDAVCSCMVLAVDVEGRKVTTIEGLAKKQADGALKLHPLQQAFVERDALQCGFCTPGMIMAGKALLERTPKPTAEEIRGAVAGNLCRCGTYPHVFAAIEQASKRAGG